MRNGNRIFDILGIEPTSDRRVIKKAYAQKVKECHPEENPEEWKQLHNAYEAALKYAKSGGNSYHVPVDIPVEREENRSIQQDNFYKVQKETKPEKQSRQEQRDREEREQKKREQEQRELEQRAIEKRKEEELNNLFREINSQNAEKKLQLKEEYSKEIDKLKECSKRQIFWQWKAFFSHPDFLRYCQESEFWKMLAETLDRLSLSGIIINYILKKLDGLEEYIAVNASIETTGKFWQVKNVCKAKKKYVTLFGIKSVKTDLRRIAILIILIAGPWIVSWQIKQTNKINVKEELTKYLDEKYGVGSYQSEDFYIEEVEVSSIYVDKDKSYAYLAKMKGDNEKEVCIWSHKDKGIKKPEVLCLDNFQQEEIEEALNQELQQAIGAESGIVYLSAAEPDYVRARSKGEAAVYHTLYEGNLQEFFEKEREVREGWIGKDQEKNFDMLGSLAQSRNINGRCAFWFPDKNVADIQQRLENPQCSYDENFCQAIKSIEEAYGIQVLATGLPQSYYASLVQELEKNQYNERNVAKRTDCELAEKAPADIPFVTMWYMAEEPDITSMMETTPYESLSPEVMQQIEEQTGVKEVPEKECEELHTIEAQKLEDGIYLMDLEEDSGFHSQRAVQHKDNEIAITCSDECSSYMLILDMEKLGIKDGNYYVQYKDNQGEEEYPIHKELPYTAIGEQYDTAWQGEGFLFIICRPSQTSGSSTYTVVLEAYPEQ